MGMFKINDTKSRIINWLISNDYKEWKPLDTYERTYRVKNHNILIRFLFSMKTIQIIDPYGMTIKQIVHVKDEWMLDLDIFINEVDKELESWIG